MKLKFLMLAAGVTVFVSCGPSYRVTDQPKTTDSAGTTTVPSNIQSAFSTQYATAGNVVWAPYDSNNLPIDWDLTGWPELVNGDYVATFTMNDDQYYAWYDANGNWIGSTYTLRDVKTLPEPVTAMINDKFAGYSIESVSTEIQKDKTAFEIKLKNGDNKVKVLADASGNIIKQKTVAK